MSLAINLAILTGMNSANSAASMLFPPRLGVPVPMDGGGSSRSGFHLVLISKRFKQVALSGRLDFICLKGRNFSTATIALCGICSFTLSTTLSVGFSFFLSFFYYDFSLILISSLFFFFVECWFFVFLNLFSYTVLSTHSECVCEISN